MTDEIRVKTGVYQAMNRVKEALSKMGGITKDRDAPQAAGGYRFRGIDEMYNVLCGLTAEHGLTMFPRVIGEPKIEFQKNAKGNMQTHVFLVIEVKYVSAEDGSSDTGVYLGEAIDTGDKAANKAMSAAFKYAHIMPFQIPTHGESDDTEAYVTQVGALAATSKANGAAPAGTLPLPEGTTKVETPATVVGSNVLSSGAHHANTFGVLHAFARQANKEEADPATWNTIRNRCVVLITQANSVNELKEAKGLIRDLGSPELLTRAANLRFQELTTKSEAKPEGT